MRGTRGAILNAKRPLYLPNYRAALQAMRKGTRNARILCAGDSFIQGWNADPANTDDYTAAWPNQLALKFVANGIPSKCDSAAGFQFAASAGVPNQNNNDPRVVMTGAAKGFASNLSLGGPIVQFPGGASTMAITPTHNVDTFKLWYLTTGSANTFNYNIDGGSNTLVSAGAAKSLTSATIACGSLASHTLNLIWVSGFNNIAGWEAWDSTNPCISLTNAGWSTSTTNQWVAGANGYTPIAGITAFAPDLMITDLGTNELNTGVSVATYTTNLQTIITTAKAVNSDVLLVTGSPWDPVGSAVSYATQSTYWAAMRQLAVQNNVPLIDMNRRWNDLTFATAQGWEATGAFSVNSHPSALGQKDWATAVFNLIGGM